MERRSKVKSREPSQDIPFDLIIDILIRLPAKSLKRFKSVSKQWSSLICSKSFTNRFLKLSSSPPRLYMWLGFEKSHPRDVLLSSTHDSDFTTMSSFIVDKDLVTIPLMNDYSISQVYRGLMVLKKGPNARIYNTTTRQLVVLPDIEESNILTHSQESANVMYHIGHDPVRYQYKVLVCIATMRLNKVEVRIKLLTEHWVLLLERDVTLQWRNISSRCPPHWPSTKGLTINGRMHYFAFGEGPDPVLVSFDINTEKLSMLEVRGLNEKIDPLWHVDLIEYRGKIAFINHKNLRDQGVMKLWVLDEEKNRWSCSNTLVLHPSQMDMVNISHYWKVLGTTINNEVILVPKHATHRTSKINCYVLLYNLQKNRLRKVEIKDSSSRSIDIIWEVIGFDDVENLMHF